MAAAVEAEATADIQAMVGASRDERALSPVRFAVAKRLPWLQINLLTAFLAAAVVGLFEHTIARYTAVQEEYGNLGLALQAYLHRTDDDIAALAEAAREAGLVF
mgnify:CR=1 FL=1